MSPGRRSRSITAAKRGTGLNASACGKTSTASTSTATIAASASAYGAIRTLFGRATRNAVNSEPAKIVTAIASSGGATIAISAVSRLLRVKSQIAKASAPIVTGTVAAEITAERVPPLRTTPSK